MAANILTKGAISMMCNKTQSSSSSPVVLQIWDMGSFEDEDDWRYASKWTRMSMYWVMLSDGVHLVQGNFDTEKKDLVEKNGLWKGSIVRLTQYVCNSLYIRDDDYETLKVSRGTFMFRRLVNINDLVLLVDKCELIGEPRQFMPASLAHDDTELYFSPDLNDDDDDEAFDIMSDGVQSSPDRPSEAVESVQTLGYDYNNSASENNTGQPVAVNLTREDTPDDMRNPSLTRAMTDSASPTKGNVSQSNPTGLVRPEGRKTAKAKRKKEKSNDESTLYLKSINKILRQTFNFEKEKWEANKKRAYQKELNLEMKVMSQSLVGLTDEQKAYWKIQQSRIMDRYKMNEVTNGIKEETATTNGVTKKISATLVAPTSKGLGSTVF